MKVNYKDLFNTVKGKVKKIFASEDITNRLEIEIENTQNTNPKKPISVCNSPSPPLRYGDYIRAYYCNADEVVTERGRFGVPVSSYFVLRNAQEEEFIYMVEILNNGAVVATYGSIGKGLVEVRKKKLK